MKRIAFLSSTLILLSIFTFGQKNPETTEIWEPVPAKVTPGENGSAPSDAIVLFDGKNFDQFESVNDGNIKWIIKDNYMTVVPTSGAIQSKQSFGSCQLHIEWKSPENDTDEGQGKGNSGIFMMSKYELQVLDSYTSKTYANGQAASIYKQHIPLVNACKKSGEWQTYDIVFTAPVFGKSGTVISPARITVLHNGILVQNNVAIWGPTEYIGSPNYKIHGKAPLQLQEHTDEVSYRNIWIREL